MGVGRDPIDQPGSSNSNLASNSVAKDRGALNYRDQLELYKAAKNDDVDKVRNIFSGKAETLEKLPPSFIYQSVGPMNNTLLHVAANFGSDNTLRFIADELMKIDPSILTRKNSKGDTALQVAAKAGHVSTARTLIIDVESSFSSDEERGLRYVTPSLLRLRNEEGNTALHEALINGHLEVAEALIEADPEVSFYLNNEGKSPLYMAAEVGSLTCVNCMLKLTVQVKTEEKLQGKSPVHAAIVNAASYRRTRKG